ncbi:hypothetical protein ACWC3X_44335 [Streptomyces populi]
MSRLSENFEYAKGQAKEAAEKVKGRDDSTSKAEEAERKAREAAAQQPSEADDE